MHIREQGYPADSRCQRLPHVCDGSQASGPWAIGSGYRFNGSVPAETADRQKKKEHGKSNLHAEEDFLQKLESSNLEPRLKKLLITYEEVFGALSLPLSCKELVQMDLKLKPEFGRRRVRMAATERSTRIPHLPPEATPPVPATPPYQEPYPSDHHVHAKGAPWAQPRQGQSLDPYHQPLPPPQPYVADPWTRGDLPPPPPVPGSTTRSPPGPADAS